MELIMQPTSTKNTIQPFFIFSIDIKKKTTPTIIKNIPQINSAILYMQFFLCIFILPNEIFCLLR